MVRDLTCGAPWKHITALALPLLLGNVFQAVYNLTDTVMVGRFAGPHALAGVGIASPVFNLLNALLIGLSVGSSILVSQLFGAKQRDKLPAALSTILWMSLALSVLLMVVGQLAAAPLLVLLKAPAEDYAYAEVYLRTILCGMVGNVFYNQLSGLLRGLGNTRVPLYFLILSNCTDVALDILFVWRWDMGAFGAALSTVLAEGLSAVLTGIYLVRCMPELCAGGERGFDREMFAAVLRFGLPMGLQQASISLGHVMMQGIINPFGTALIDGYAAAAKVDTFAVMPVVSIATAASSFSAQNAGAGRYDRVRRGHWAGCVMVVGVCAALVLLVSPWSGFWVGLFVPSDAYPELVADIVAKGAAMLAVTPAFYWMLGLIHVTLNTMAGAGDTMFSMQAMIGMMFLRVLAAWSLIRFADMGEAGIWWSFPVSWAVALLLTMCHYFRGTWRSKGLNRKTVRTNA